MHSLYRYICLFSVVGLLSCKPTIGPSTPPDQPKVNLPALEKACQWKQGGGSTATGGEGGLVYFVTDTLDEKDPQTGLPKAGTLRHAVEQSGTRVVLFRTSGTIHLSRQLDIKHGNLTIAGQSAPGDGICIAGYPVCIKGANNVIIRFLRFRMGDSAKVEGDALSVNDATDVIIDHCSFSWSTDECVSCYGNTNFTLQYCFITESLRRSVHVKGNHGYGGIWGGTNATFHHNLLAHHDSRNPRFDHSYVNGKCFGPLDYVNNVVYNWGSNSAYGGEGLGQARQINFVNNYYKPGAATKSGVRTRLLDPTDSCSNCSKDASAIIPAQFYLNGNYMYGSEPVTADNWQGATVQTAAVHAATRWTDGLTALTTEQTTEEAFETVLAKAGCSLRRDAIDSRIADEVRNGTYTYKGSNGSTGGLIDSQSDVGGWIGYASETAPADTDFDGIPDEWETAHGLNPKSRSDAKAQTLVKGHTNLEVYLNSLVSDLY